MPTAVIGRLPSAVAPVDAGGYCSGCRQRSSRPGPSYSSGTTLPDTSVRQSSWAWSQRGANAQPCSHGIVSRAEPRIGCSGVPRPVSRRGTEASSPPV